ncbi:MAG: type I restriction endonuclease subunit R [Endozoicomonas sp. (ex Botrylloides leachii)]|nr:type I restriction endonuclease subunit R [Endozoicomonas sp. (ex Botrylloides leachii)]
MSTQSEQQLENNLIAQLAQNGFERVTIHRIDDLKANLKVQLERVNNMALTNREFDHVLIKLEKGSLFDKSKRLSQRLDVVHDNGEVSYLSLLFDDPAKNHFQVTHQITLKGTYENRYDVTILVNGLPLAQIELKRRGLEMTEAFHQIKRYTKHSYHAEGGLFHYIQLFVISNGVNTKYFSNNRELSFKQTFHWTDVNNHKFNELTQFAEAFLTREHLTKMLSRYIVQNEAGKFLMVLRPYQFYAVEAMINQVATTDKNGYIWHTTGSGKTLTSFKAAQIVSTYDTVDRVVFVVDRKDLDYQTAKEFNAFSKGCVDSTANTQSLLKQFHQTSKHSASPPDALPPVAENQSIDSHSLNRIHKLTVTTIQKLNNLITNPRFKEHIRPSAHERIVFIFDECHRSQFGETHQNIIDFFKNAQLFGFTGTPIFAENATSKKVKDRGSQKRTTKDLFGERLHSYVIVDAIRDDNVLPFAIEYYGRLSHKDTGQDVEVSSIDVAEFFSSPERIRKVCEHIVRVHPSKTKGKFNSLLCVASLPDLVTYYETLKALKREGVHDLKWATIFSYGVNEDKDYESKGKTVHSRDKLEEYIADYNRTFGTAYSTKDTDSFYNYYKDIAKRTKDGEIDILLVINMFLTGFDAPGMNTIYVDKNLQYHGLVQAFSRTNRLNGTVKSHGNVVCYRNLKTQADDAFRLFSNKQPIEAVEIPDLSTLEDDFHKALDALKTIAPTVQSVDELPDEDALALFIKQFRILMRLKNQLETFSDFAIEDLGMDEQEFVDYASKYSDLSRKIKGNPSEKASIVQNIDFELELLQSDHINVSYIRQLLQTLAEEENPKAREQKCQVVANLLASEPELHSKRELIEGFIAQSMEGLNGEQFDAYVERHKQRAFNHLISEEQLDPDKFKVMLNHIEQGWGVDKFKGDDFAKLTTQKMTFQTRRREVIPRITERVKAFVDTFVTGF